jgi:2-polyprenyl-3-methyl-5-hydroxy-6-metoxy-1,4-benzoquinol methylase
MQDRSGNNGLGDGWPSREDERAAERSVVFRSDEAIQSTDSARLDRRAYAPRHAFDIDPKRPQRYRLRLSRYMVLAQDISDWAGAAALAGRALSVLDVGCGWGPLLNQLEAEPHFDNIRISACDMADAELYKRELYQEFFVGDLAGGYPEIGSGRYDVGVCEQVLEHLDKLDSAVATLVRVTRPGGILVIGVPIFFPPLHLARKYLVPRLAGILRHPETASHLQAFSLFSFLPLLRAYPNLSIVKTRGFRIISGGLLRPLENYRWWWQLNRRIGELLPALCIEVQIILRKSPASP